MPGLVISPYARQGYIDHQTLSHDAYLKFIEDDFLGGARLDPATDGRPDPRPTCARTPRCWAICAATSTSASRPALRCCFPRTRPAGPSPGALHLQVTPRAVHLTPVHGRLAVQVICSELCQLAGSATLVSRGAQGALAQVKFAEQVVPEHRSVVLQIHHALLERLRRAHRHGQRFLLRLTIRALGPAGFATVVNGRVPVAP